MAAELAMLDAVGQAELVRKRELTPLELADAAIARIEAVDPMLNAVVIRRFESARAEAASAELPDGPLRGVPFLVKDLGASLAGVLDTAGSRALRDHFATDDSPLVRRYRAAGLVILGRTSTPEFGNHSTTEPELYGPTRNPWDTARSTGGSSGGSAAAVAALMVPAAHASDGAGSIRIPASCCGVFGLKPTRARVSRAPAGEDIGGLLTAHAVTRSVRDSAALLDIESGREPGDPSWLAAPERPFAAVVGEEPGRLRIGFSAEPTLDVPVDDDCVAAVRSTAALLESLGHEVEEASPTFDAEVLVGPLVTVWALANLADATSSERIVRRPLRRDELEITTWELVEYGRTRSALDVAEAVEALSAAARAIAPFFERYDAWLTPTLARRPEPLGVLNQSQGGAVEYWRFDCSFNPWNPVANITGHPAMSVPLHWTEDGLPIGSLLTGRFGDEATLLRLAAQLEAARPWAARVPPVHA